MTNEFARRAKVAKLWRYAERACELESELCELRNETEGVEGVEDLRDEHAEAFDVLRAVRDWMHDVMFLQRPMRDPRVIQRKVDRALGY